MATRTISAAGGNWNTTGAWAEGAVPTNADDVVATASSGNLTVTASSVCRSINLTNYTGTLTHNSTTLSIGNSGVPPSLNSLVFPASGFTLTGVLATYNFVSTSASTVLVNFGGRSLLGGTINFGPTASGNWRLSGNIGSAATLTHTRGILDTNSFSIGSVSPIGTFSAPTGVSRTLLLRASTITCNSLSILNTVVLNAGTSTIIANGNFLATGYDFYNVIVNPTGANVIRANSIVNLTVAITAARTISFPAGNTTTVTGDLTLQGTSGNLLSLASTTPGTTWTIDAQGTTNISYVDVQDSIATTPITAGTGSVNSGNNTNWTFPGGSTFQAAWASNANNLLGAF